MDKQKIPARNCPLEFLSVHPDKIRPHQLTLLGLDQRVRLYLKLPESERSLERQQIFSSLSPFLRKSLSRYCRITSGCSDCRIGGLLSTAFIDFTHLIDRFDPEHNVNFLGYIVNGLSWGLFNNYKKERRYCERFLSLPADLVDEREKTEERWLSSTRVEELMSALAPRARDLFVLYYLFGYSCADLATLQETTANAIQKRIGRARKRILERYGNKPLF